MDSICDGSDAHGANAMDTLSCRRIVGAVAGLGSVVVCLWPVNLWAYLPLFEQDYVIATRAELMVVGRLKSGSVEYLPTESHFSDGKIVKGFYRRARLIITRVAAGTLKEQEITVWFCGGAVPLVEGRYVQHDGSYRLDQEGHPRHLRGSFPPDSIQIAELNSSLYLRTNIDDRRTEHIWFLRSRTDVPGATHASLAWSVGSWQDVDDASLRSYYAAFLATDPIHSLSVELLKHEDRAQTIRPYLGYLRLCDLSRTDGGQHRWEKIFPRMFLDVTVGRDEQMSLKVSD
jgi:hypothetical protein